MIDPLSPTAGAASRLFLAAAVLALRLGRGAVGAMITLHDVELRHGSAGHPVRPVSGAFEPGSLTALIGANGSGKTTLLRAIAGLHPLASGPDRPRRICWQPTSRCSRRAATSIARFRSPAAMSWRWRRPGWVRSARSARTGWRRRGPRWSASAWRRWNRARSRRCPPASSSACCSPAPSCRTPADPAGRTVHRRRRRDDTAAAVGDRGLARRRAAPSSPCCTISTWCGGISRTRCC